jgi:aerobic-type carbon monoxide dehydrogenase small subunit (CoxS/CutS family)
LREQLHCRSVKDGCSPQGQCGCCTVWVDGAARVACVTALRRVAGRSVTTVDGLAPELRDRWVEAFVAAGASQCGFCTPGILLRLTALEQGRRPATREAVESALLAHLCRCTGWQSIVEAACVALGIADAPAPALGPGAPGGIGDPLLAAWRAQLEGPMFQSSGAEVVLGGGGFADDTAPVGAQIRLGAADTPLAPDLASARRGSGKVQGRNSTVPLTHPVALPEGEWALTLRTTWVEPAYLEPDASWARPGAPPATPLANGGAFGGKRRSPAPGQARDLASAAGDAVRVLWSREDVVRHGPKRPPLALGLRPNGSGLLRVGRTPGSPDLSPLIERVHEVAPGVVVEEVEVMGPPVGPELRGAGWAEVVAALASLPALVPALVSAAASDPELAPAGPGVGQAEVALPNGSRAAVSVHAGGRGSVTVEVWAGELLHEVTLRSYVLGAVHQALGLVWSEGIAVDDEGAPLDLTIRSFGILSAREMPEVHVVLHPDDRWPVNGSDAVFAATLAAAWIADGRPGLWPTRRGGVRHQSSQAPPPPVAPSSGTATATSPPSAEEQPEL